MDLAPSRQMFSDFLNKNKIFALLAVKQNGKMSITA